MPFSDMTSTSCNIRMREMECNEWIGIFACFRTQWMSQECLYSTDVTGEYVRSWTCSIEQEQRRKVTPSIEFIGWWSFKRIIQNLKRHSRPFVRGSRHERWNTTSVGNFVVNGEFTISGQFSKRRRTLDGQHVVITHETTADGSHGQPPKKTKFVVSALPRSLSNHFDVVQFSQEFFVSGMAFCILECEDSNLESCVMPFSFPSFQQRNVDLLVVRSNILALGDFHLVPKSINSGFSR
mmetsp:Transcript_36300/g.55768  ORF Transcript_36300/g.55768 Transcript_36300/m.55768 type:complete len:238 (+) Transcript_36300:359-1072(+)